MSNIIDLSGTHEIIFVSLADTGIFKSYEISSNEDLKEAYNQFEEYCNKFGYIDQDIELQVNASTCINDSNVNYLSDYFDMVEFYEVDINLIVDLHNYYTNIEDVKHILNNGLYSVYEGSGFNPSLDAFYEYVEDMGILNNIPENLRSYFDYEKYLQDLQYEGLTVIEGSGNNIYFVSY